jgi:hypothetical protein
VKSTPLLSATQDHSITFGRIERWVLWFLPSLFGSALGVAVGPLSGFDLLNRRWFTGWVMLSGSEGVTGAAASILRLPWLHDGFVALLLATDIWWLGPAVLGAVHGLIVPISYRCIRTAVPRLSRTGSTVLASVGVMTPLALMHVGRETGHLLVALVLGLAVERFLRRPDDGFRIGLLLGFAPIIKVSALVVALVLGLAFLLGLRGMQKIRFIFGSAAVIWFGALFLTLWVRLGLGLGEESNRWSFFPIFGQRMSVMSVAFISTTLVLVGWFVLFHNFNLRLARTFASLRPLSVPTFLTLTFFVALFIRHNGLGDPRFRPLSSFGFLQQMLVSGNARVRAELSDWEIVYLDNSRMVILIFTVGAVLLAVNPRLTELERRMLLTALAIGSSIIAVQASLGYVRYASPSIALAPIAIGCVVGMNRGRRLWNEVLVGSVSLILLLPVAHVSTWFKAPGIQSYSAYSSLLSEDEKYLVNSLLPEGSTAFIFGAGTSSVAPAVGRTDVVWFFRPQRPSEANVAEATLFYDPSATRDLDKFSTRGWLLDPCQTLRLENVSYGWCALTAGPEAESG